MFKERIKSSAIFILIINLIFLTSQLWFVNSSNSLGESLYRYIREFPIAERFFPIEAKYSISKENLSKPRKLLVNDGSLWMAYYNTDRGYAPIEARTRELIKAFLSGEVTASRKIDRSTWEAGLESLSIYVEYPVEFSTEMLCKIMGIDAADVPEDISSLREFVIIPSSEESDICILTRGNEESDIYAHILKRTYTFPSTDLAVYTTSDGYYQPAFSTGLELDEKSNVSLAPLVLFSDSQPTTQALLPHNLIGKNFEGKLLENFQFNYETTPYEDSQGAMKYIANYASATIYPDSVFEYTAVSEDRGIILDESGDSYNVLNASIDFAEKVWESISNEPLSILVSSDLSNYDSTEPYTFKFDYYLHGRPVKVDIEDAHGHEKMNCAIEITVKGGRLISYRQYMRSYQNVFSEKLAETFVSALDNFVSVIDKVSKEDTVIEDIYIGYLDNGNDAVISAAWLSSTDDGKIYRYKENFNAEVSEE